MTSASKPLVDKIETTRLVLRLCRLADAEDMSLLMQPEISRWVAAWPTPLSRAQAANILAGYLNEYEKGHNLPFTATIKETGEVIGWLSITLENGARRWVELSYWIGLGYHRRGFAFEMANAGIDYAFSQLGVHEVVAGAQQTNTASLALFAKLGLSVRETKMVWSPARDRCEKCEFWVIGKGGQ